MSEAETTVRAATFEAFPDKPMKWDELRPLLAPAYRAATRLSNWAVSELAKAEASFKPGEKIPKQSRSYLYSGTTPAAVRHRAEGWHVPERGAVEMIDGELSAASASQLLQNVERVYRKTRFDYLRAVRSLPTFRYPQPIPIHNKDWTPSVGTDGRLLVTFKLGPERVTLRLGGGPAFHRQRAQFLRIVSEEAKRGVLELYERGGKLMVKCVARFPLEGQRERTGALIVTTTADSMLVAANVKDARLFSIHGDHVRRWQAEHSVQLQRWADDSKMELRRHVPFHERREEASARFNRRMNTAAAEMAAQVVGYADRRGFAEVRWLLGEARFVESFRWDRLALEMKWRCEQTGIHFEELRAVPVGEPRAEALATSEVSA